MKKTLFVFAIIASCLSCKKNDKKQYSYWYINTDSFSTNDVRVEAGNARHEMITNNLHNGFQITFNLGAFPIAGSFKMDCSQMNPDWVCVNILYNDTGYLANPDSFAKAFSPNGKGQYIVPNTWFYNSYNSSDSILVHGTFNEP